MIITVLMYHKIHRLRNSNLSIRQIAVRLGFSKNTVKKYLAMSQEEFNAYSHQYHNRVKCFDKYANDIVNIYHRSNDPNLSAASVYDVLEEIYGSLPASERSFRTYIHYLKLTGRIGYGTIRQYETVPELPYGKQMQLDFGEFRMKASGRKFYILAALLTRSRYRYVQVYDSPLTTTVLIEGLLDCFEYFGGIPEEIVIDQDHLMVAREISGEVEFTEKFETFRNEMGFKVYVCRKADPESKGKVENLVRFVKRSFFASRPMTDLQEVRKRLSLWLSRKANGKISAAISMKPSEAFMEEKSHLKPLKNSIFTPADKCMYETRKADKTALISVKGIKLQVPHNYAGREVLVYITDDRADIRDINTRDLLVQYSFTRGIIKTTAVRLGHKRMEKRLEIKNSLSARFHFKEWNTFLEGWYEYYSRFSKEQFMIFARYENEYTDETRFINAVRYCIETESFSMNSLHEAYTLADSGSPVPPSGNTAVCLNTVKHYKAPVVAQRSLGEYIQTVTSTVRTGTDYD